MYLRTIPTGANPIPIGDNTGFQRAVFTDPFGDYDGDGHANNAEVTSGSNFADPTDVPTTLTISGNRMPGGTAVLTYTDTNAIPGLQYQMACSFTAGQIPVGKKRRIPLAIDNLFILTLNVPAIFQNFSGLLDASGSAVGTIQIPNIPQLSQLSIGCAAVTFQPFFREGIQSISPPVPLVIQ